MIKYMRMIIELLPRRNYILPEDPGNIPSYEPPIWKPEITSYQHPISEKKSYTPKLDLAIEYLKANPDTTKSNRKIAEELGISHPVVAQAKEILKNGS